MKNTSRAFQRRADLGSRFPRTLFVIAAGEESRRSHSVNHRFKPASDYAYLTGQSGRPGTVLVIAGAHSYVSSPEPDDGVWDDAGTESAADHARLECVEITSASRLHELIASHLGEVDRLALAIGRDPAMDHAALDAIAYRRSHPRHRRSEGWAVCDSRPLVGQLRLLKDEDEIAWLREAAQRSSMVHCSIMSAELIGRTEREVSNSIESGLLSAGMQWPAYETIVGTGPRSALLHARATDRVVADGDVLVIDAGGEWNGYCADITRTLPAGLRFTSEQRAVYEVVLAAQEMALAAAKPGATLTALNDLARDALGEGLSRLNLLDASASEPLKTLMPHSTSHWIGRDVHDPSPHHDERGEPIRLQQGMCFTVEPGLYFKDRFGVRIEDDVLITVNGCEIMSSVPKAVDYIEAARAHSRRSLQ